MMETPPPLYSYGTKTPVTYTRPASVEIRFAGIADCVKAFRSNCERIEYAYALPSLVCSLAYEMAVVMMGTIGKKPSKLSEAETRNEIYDRLFREKVCSPDYFSKPVDVSDVEKFVKLTGDVLVPGLESVIASQITGAWTAFEVLAGDLWECSLNCHPETLANLNSGSRSDAKQVNDSKSIDVQMLAKYRFDVKNHMGSILKKKFNFTILDGIIAAYNSAFGRSEIKSVVESKALRRLSLFRNVLVHRGGIADKDFCDAMKNLDSGESYTIGQKMSLDGTAIDYIVVPAIAAAWELIKTVDDYLVGG